MILLLVVVGVVVSVMIFLLVVVGFVVVVTGCMILINRWMVSQRPEPPSESEGNDPPTRT